MAKKDNTEEPLADVVTVTISAQKHTHAGIEYNQGDQIEVAVDLLPWLIENNIIEG